jgi:hypothetical protein
MAQERDEDRIGAAPSPEELRDEMKRTRRILSRKLGILKERLLGASSSSTEPERRNMPAKKASGKSTKSRKQSAQKSATNRSTTSTTKSKRSASGSKRSTTSAAKGRKGAEGKKSSKRASSVVARKAKKVIGNVLTAAAAGAVKGAVKEIIPPVEKAAGITEERLEEQEQREETNHQK